MTNLTLQPYSTKLAKHQPPDLRHPTEKKKKKKEKEKKKEKKERKKARAPVYKKKKKKKRKGGSNLLQTLQPSTAGYSP